MFRIHNLSFVSVGRVCTVHTLSANCTLRFINSDKIYADKNLYSNSQFVEQRVGI